MSLIPLVAPHIRLAARNVERAQDFHDAVLAAGQEFDLVFANVQLDELSALDATEWHWYASWRQELGGDLSPIVIEYLTAITVSRYARFKLRRLVLRDRTTNQYAAGELEGGDEPPFGASWLVGQALAAQPELATELMEDALQCATDASWFLLYQLTTVGESRGLIIEALRGFAETRGLSRGLTARWGLD